MIHSLMFYRSLFIALILLTAEISHASAERPLCEEATSSQAFPAIRLERIATGLSQPVGLIAPRDGSGRLFIVEQLGTIQIWAKSSVLSQSFLDLRDRVATGYEMGRRIPVRCFLHDPSVKSSLTFLRKTPWARQKVEAWFIAELK